jgi:enamine deaminase RidA (YjgF/YER057c/UK114 family)
MVTGEGPRPASAEQRLQELGIQLPTPPEPFGIYAEAVQTGNLLFLTGMLPPLTTGPNVGIPATTESNTPPYTTAVY